MEERNIVVVGGGFAGVAALRKLWPYRRELRRRGLRLILVDQNHYHTYTPSLYEVANHEVASRTIAVPFHALFGRALTVRHELVTEIDPKRRRLLFGPHAPELEYDYLLLCSGTESADFGIPGLKSHALGLKTLDEAVVLRDRLESLIIGESRGRKVRVVVGGGGFTGVELAAELAHHADRATRELSLPPHHIEILLLEAGARLLAGLEPDSAERARDRLQASGVKVFLETMIAAVTHDVIETKDGGEIPYDLFIWTGGVRPSALSTGLPVDEHGAVQLDNYLRVPSHPEIFAAGDIAALRDRHGHHLPPTAEPAELSGQAAATNLLRTIRGRSLRPARLRHSGYIVPLGGRYSIFRLWGVEAHGTFAWLTQQLTYFYYLLHILPFRQAFKRWRRFEELLDQS